MFKTIPQMNKECYELYNNLSQLALETGEYKGSTEFQLLYDYLTTHGPHVIPGTDVVVFAKYVEGATYQEWGVADPQQIVEIPLAVYHLNIMGNPEVGDQHKKLTTFLTEHAEWSKKTFGSFGNRGPVGPLKHMAKEVPEAIEAHNFLVNTSVMYSEDHKEYDKAVEEYRYELADLFLLLVDAIHRSQWSFFGMLDYAKIKLERNKKREWDVPMSDEPCEHRRGFTLIELLASITVIAILMALSLVAINKVRESFRRTQCKDDIGQFTTAGAAFKTRYGVNPHWYRSHIPPQTKFRLCSSYVDRNGELLKENGQVWPEVEILMNLYPSMNMKDNGLRLRGGVIPPDVPEQLDPTQFFFFLLTGGEYTNWQGFSYNKKQPFTPPVNGEEKREVFLQINNTKKLWNMELGEFDGYYRDPWGDPYIVHLTPYTYGPQRGKEPDKTYKRDSFQIVSVNMDNIEK